MLMTEKILLTTDLDRTLLPNGKHRESDHARELFRAICKREDIILVYVSGRDKQLLLNAIAEYDIPLPDYAIGDVGSTIYHIENRQWHLDQDWQQHIALDWQPYNHSQLADLLSSIQELRLQEASKQNQFKLSYYLDLVYDDKDILQRIEYILAQKQIMASIIWSIDEPNQVGLIDILPRSANKLEAIRFLGRKLNIAINQTLFAGDSGNDLSVLCSDVPAVLVANAEDYVRHEAQTLAQANHTEAQLYIASGNFMDMNGNYAAGILQGLAHYFPEAKTWLLEASSSLNISSSS